MHHLFKAVSLTHKHSPVSLRERVALNAAETAGLLEKIKAFTSVQDALVLSTCNRTEIYYTHEEDISSDLIKLLGVLKGVDALSDYDTHFIRYNQETAAIRHLFYVAMGLEAQVVGDLQISNQMKRAYQASADAGMAGPFLHRLMHTIFFTNKRVVQETSFRDGAASVSYAATELAYDLASAVIHPKILIVGLGEIGRDVCKNLGDADAKRGRQDITIINRTAEKAEAEALTYGFKTLPFSQLSQAVAQADIIISSVSAPQPLISADWFRQGAIHGHKYFIDLAVPRSVDTAVEHLPGVLLYNVDDIQNKANDALNKRLAAVPDVQAIIEETLTELKQWAQEMEVSPTIQRLKNALEQIRQEEMARYLKDVDGPEKQQIEKITKSMMQKIIKLPVLQLKAACQRGEAETLIDVLNDLFDLEKQPIKR